ncbi:asparagine synthase-related protein [Streptomyces sp. NPDC088745]|uniref:asparagine synthase-related protein n=1 Tax=Streptomyces sp. NPDC088745 TaxID=3365884 RepID=UPI00380632D5
MSKVWVAGGPGQREPADGTAVSGAVRAWSAGCAVRSQQEGMVSVNVLGDCRVNTGELYRTGLDAVRRGRWTELTRWSGSYWVVARHGERTFVAGDLAGVRGLFVGQGADGLVWGSHAARVAAATGSPGPDLGLLAAQIVAGAEHWPERSVYANVQQVPGGRGLLIEDGQHTTVDVTGLSEPVTLTVGAGRVGGALRAAVEGYVSPHEVVGADLSGGLDSSTAVLLAAQRRQVCAVTYGGELASAEDTEFAARVAAHSGIAQHLYRGGPETWHFSGPPPAATDAPTLSAAITGLDAAYLRPAAGLGVHLTGHGGDVVLESSTAAFVDLVQQGRTREAKAQATTWARLQDTAPGPLWRQVKTAAAQGRGQALEDAATLIERSRPQGEALVWSWCQPGAAAAWLTPEGRTEVARLLRESARWAPDVRAGQWDDWQTLRLNGASARHEISLYEPLRINPVFPYLDNEVVRACYAIPAHERRRSGQYKPLLGAALPELPTWLSGRRSKGSFGPVLLAGLRANRQALHRLLAASPFVREGLLDAAAVAAALNRAAAGDAAAPRAALQLLLTTCLWLNHLPQHLPTPAPAESTAC